MKSMLVLLAISTLVAAPGCGSGDGTPASSADQEQGTSTCGSRGYVFKLQRVDCELVNAMIVLLNGRSRHQTLTLSSDHGKTTWTCRSASIVGPLECRDGARSFRMEKE
jgi:hypothetical protein